MSNQGNPVINERSHAQTALRRPPAVTVLAVLNTVGGVVLLVGGIVLMALAAAEPDPAFLAVAAAVLAALGVACLACAAGLWMLQPYGRAIQMILAVLALVTFPLGTIVGVLLLVYLRKPGARVLFSGRPPPEWTDAERGLVKRDMHGTLGIAVIVVIAVLPALGVPIMAAIAIPGLLRARMAGNEAMAIGSIRAVQSAQLTFASTCGHGGYAPSLSALNMPPPAVNGAEPFLGPELNGDPVIRSGYRISVVGGEKQADGTPSCSGSDVVRRYIVLAEPVSEATGIRYFAASEEGTILQSSHPIPADLSVPWSTRFPDGAQQIGD